MKKHLILIVTLIIICCDSDPWDPYNDYNPDYDSRVDPDYVPFAFTCWDDFISRISTDPDRPLLSLEGDMAVAVGMGYSYSDQGATAQDPADGDISGQIQVSGLSDVDTGIPGDYIITYNVTNSNGIAANPVSRIVRVGEHPLQSIRPLTETTSPMGYLEHLPVFYEEADREPGGFPLLVFFHGHGGSVDLGATLEGLMDYEMNYAIHDPAWDNSRPFVILCPQLNVQTMALHLATEDNPSIRADEIRDFIDYALQTYNVDPARIYISGFSAGSVTVWEYLRAYPVRVAAALAISGSGYYQELEKYAHVPIWACQGTAEGDGYSRVPWMALLIIKIRRLNPDGDARFTLIEGHGHYAPPWLLGEFDGMGMEPWDILEPDLYSWLLTHRREP